MLGVLLRAIYNHIITIIQLLLGGGSTQTEVIAASIFNIRNGSSNVVPVLVYGLATGLRKGRIASDDTGPLRV